MCACLPLAIWGCGDGDAGSAHERTPPRAVIEQSGRAATYGGGLLGEIDGVIYDGVPGTDPRAIRASGGEIAVHLPYSDATSLEAAVESAADQTNWVTAEVDGEGQDWTVRLPAELPPDPYLKLSAPLAGGGVHAWAIDIE